MAAAFENPGAISTPAVTLQEELAVADANTFRLHCRVPSYSGKAPSSAVFTRLHFEAAPQSPLVQVVPSIISFIDPERSRRISTSGAGRPPPAPAPPPDRRRGRGW